MIRILFSVPLESKVNIFNKSLKIWQQCCVKQAHFAGFKDKLRVSVKQVDSLADFKDRDSWQLGN